MHNVPVIDHKGYSLWHICSDHIGMRGQLCSDLCGVGSETGLYHSSFKHCWVPVCWGGCFFVVLRVYRVPRLLFASCERRRLIRGVDFSLQLAVDSFFFVPSCGAVHM